MPLGLLAAVLWREHPWTVELSPRAPWAMAAVIVLNFAVSLPIRAARWRFALIDPPPFRQALAATFEGLLANTAIGFGSGDLVRAARLRQDTRKLAVDYASTWAERGAELLALTILVFVAALLNHLGTTTLVLAALTAAAYLAVLGAGHWLTPRLGRWPRLAHVLSAALAASTPRRVAAVAGLSLLGWAVESVMHVIFQGAFDLQPSFRMALLTLAFANAAIIIPTLPGNFGTYEAGVTLALVMSGAPRAVGVSYGLTYHLTHSIPVAAVATAVYFVRSARPARPADPHPGG